jgi:hypothetical protein
MSIDDGVEFYILADYHPDIFIFYAICPLPCSIPFQIHAHQIFHLDVCLAQECSANGGRARSAMGEASSRSTYRAASASNLERKPAH